MAAHTPHTHVHTHRPTHPHTHTEHTHTHTRMHTPTHRFGNGMLDRYNNWMFHDMCYAFIEAGMLPILPGYEGDP